MDRFKIDLSSIGGPTIQKGINYLKNNGVSGIISQVRYKMTGPGLAYNGWYKEKHEPDEEELRAQRETEFEYKPLISILVPVYMTPEFFLRALIESVQAQTYANWQLCLVDGSQAEVNDVGDEEETDVYEKVYSLETEKIIRQYMEDDPRIEYKLMQENLGISDNSNVALSMAQGEYVMVLCHDDTLSEDALFSFVSELQNEKYDLLYADEDKMSEDGTKYSNPAFKPDYSVDLLRAYNYINHSLMVKKNLAVNIGGFNSEYDGAQAYDFVLRLVEVTDSIKHIPRVVYHYRISNKSNVASEHKKEYAREIGRKALTAHINRVYSFATVSNSECFGLYKVTYETPGNPFISIVIPGCNDVTLLDKCLTPLFMLSRYSNFEIIIVDTDGEDRDLLLYFKNKEKQRKNIKVVTYKQGKNLPNIRNYGAQYAKGNYLFFLDPMVELIDTTAIGEMLGLCMRKEIGIVGGTLYNDNNTVYEEGLVLGINGVYSRLYEGTRKGMMAYLMHNRVNFNCSAVTAGCMMLKKALFDQIGGFSDNYKSELADIELCLRIGEQGYSTVCAVDAGWYRHEIKQELFNIEGNKTTREYNAECEFFKFLWEDIMTYGDPYYNINFAKNGALFELDE